MSEALTFWLLAALALAGAVAVVFSRDALRLVLGLGAFLLAVAGLYAYYGMGFLAAAQVFVYVGGVLVLVLFALLLLARDGGGRLLAEGRFDLSAAAVGLGLTVVLGVTLRDLTPPAALGASADLGGTLLGPMLPAFELLGVLLLAALVATLVVVGGGERS
ncbi:MAG TPA: NADH-quinone oxidoreductase subunit J [Coriobacteriia bacterium]